MSHVTDREAERIKSIAGCGQSQDERYRQFDELRLEKLRDIDPTWWREAVMVFYSNLGEQTKGDSNAE